MAAAQALGLKPVMIALEMDAEIEHDVQDVDSNRVSDLIDGLYAASYYYAPVTYDF